MPSMRSWVVALRPKQWTKNLVLFAPLIFAKEALNPKVVERSVLAVVGFSLLASSVYLLNDWFDKAQDQLHPEKKKRPIAAGLLSMQHVAVGVVSCWMVVAAISWMLGENFCLVLLAYLVLQALYTTWLKKLVVLDVMAIALGFILRVYAGAVAISVQVSNWLFLCTLLLAVFLGFAKRRHELELLAGEAKSHRKNLEHYSLSLIDQLMSISAACTILAYALYTVAPDTVGKVGGDHLKFTVPCVIYGVFRYLFLVHKKGQGGAPEKVLLSDLPLMIDIVVFLAISMWALY